MVKKILYIDDFFEGGGAEKVCQDTLHLMKNAFEVDMFYGTRAPSKAKGLFEYISSKEYSSKLYFKLIEFKPDIIHIHNYYHILSPSILTAILKYKRQYSTKIVFTAHDFHLLAPNSGYTYFDWLGGNSYMIKKSIKNKDLICRKWDKRGVLYSVAKQLQWIYNYKFKSLDNAIDIFIAPSEFLSCLLQEKYKKQIYTLRNPITSVLPEISSKKHLEIKKELIFIGRVSPEKGLVQFIDRIKNILNTNEFYFTIIGDGEDVEEVVKLIQKLSLEKKVKLVGRKTHNEAMTYLKNSHCLVLPSLWYENAPLSLVEGAMYKNKLLTMEYGGMKEIANICGNTCFIGDSDDEIVNFIQDSNFVDNTNRIEEIFSSKQYSLELEKIYANL